jgi:hypothetical protein
MNEVARVPLDINAEPTTLRKYAETSGLAELAPPR